MSVTIHPNWWTDVPQALEEQAAILEARIEHIHDQTPEGEALRSLAEEFENRVASQVQEAKEVNRLAFVKLSWEQALKCNAWVWGITFLCDFDANRKGKTAGGIISAQMWMVPNDPEWRMFEPYVDDWDRHVEVLQRPLFKRVLEIQQYLDEHPELKGDPKQQPYDPDNAEKFAILRKALPHCFYPAWPRPSHTDSKCVMWVGAPDADYHKQIIMPEWRKWLPSKMITHDSDFDKRLEVTVSYPDNGVRRKTVWQIHFKSYESKDEKFSGAAVKAIVLTEGVKQAHLNEIKQRFQEDAFASWDYTPYESRNAGVKSALAYKVFKGKEMLPLRPCIYTGFGIEKTPSYILPDSKRRDLINVWSGKAEGEARIKGNFYASSPLILTNLDSELHCIPWSKQELFERFPNGRIFRGLDPGWDHPTACAWGLLTPENNWFIYRMYAEPRKSLGQRCDDIIRLSGNARHKVPYGKGIDEYYYEEVQVDANSEIVTQTIADYHIFKTDEQSGRPYASNYTLEGLILTPSNTYGPKERGQKMDAKLEPSLYKAHPVRRIPPGARIYFLINEPGVALAFEKLENLFWARYAGGEKKGEPKDEMQDHEDDEFDAISYLVTSNMVWTKEKPRPRYAREVEPNRQKVAFFAARRL